MSEYVIENYTDACPSTYEYEIISADSPENALEEAVQKNNWRRVPEDTGSGAYVIGTITRLEPGKKKYVIEVELDADQKVKKVVVNGEDITEEREDDSLGKRISTLDRWNIFLGESENGLALEYFEI